MKYLMKNIKKISSKKVHVKEINDELKRAIEQKLKNSKTYKIK